MKHQIFKKKLNKDGSYYIDPITNDFVVEVFYEEIIQQNIDEVKKEKFKEIDLNTQKKIENGFEFNGVVFSLSANAQIRWSNIKNVPKKYFPLPLSTLTEKIYLLNSEDVNDFYEKFIETINNYLKAGSLIKNEVFEIEAVDELNGFKDAR